MTSGIKKTNNTFPDFLDQHVDDVARQLLGCYFDTIVDGTTVLVRIVETEAYDQTDEASHTFRGQTPRNATIFGPSGHMYVYFTYGMHYCCNVVVGKRGHGAGVLIRAVEPVKGKEALEHRRGIIGVNATNGPAKLCQALGITRQLDGHDLRQSPVRLLVGTLKNGEQVATSPRVGISRARDIHRRFYIRHNPYASR